MEPRPAPIAFVAAVHVGPVHGFSKSSVEAIHLTAGVGVDGDAHAGPTVRHRSRVALDPNQPNLRQVHLIAGELHDELAAGGFVVGAGDIGENITTRGIDLLALATGTTLRLGTDALIAITGLRNPCVQLDRFSGGLRAAVLDRDDAGALVRRAGVMAVVLQSGSVSAGDPIAVSPPPLPHHPLEPRLI